MAENKTVFFQQLEMVGSDKNFSYIVGDLDQRDNCILIDPGFELERLMRVIEQHEFTLSHIFLTHSHYDHCQIAGKIKERTGAKFVIHTIEREFSLKPVLPFDDNDIILQSCNAATKITELNLGQSLEFSAIHTPGHTPGSVCYLLNKSHLFTGDTLFIDRCGKTSFRGGNPEHMLTSLKKLKSLAKIYPNLIFYPGHNYGRTPFKNLLKECETNRSIIARNIGELELSTNP